MFAGSYYSYLVNSYEHMENTTPFEYIKKLVRENNSATEDINDIIQFIIHCYSSGNTLNDDIFNKLFDDLYEHTLTYEHLPKPKRVDPQGYYKYTMDYYDEYIAFMETDYDSEDSLHQLVNKLKTRLEELKYGDNLKYTILVTALFLKIF